MKRIRLNLYFRDRPRKDGTSPILLSISYGNSNTYVPIGSTRILASQWDSRRRRVVNHPHASTINSVLTSILGRAEDAVLELTRNGGVRGWSFEKICEAVMAHVFPEQGCDTGVLSVMREYMDKSSGAGTKGVFKSTISRLEDYAGASAERLSFEDVTPSWLEEFDRWLMGRCPSANSRSIHMRNIRTVFNYALNHDLTSAKYPFRQFKIKHQDTQPNALTLEQLRLLWNYVPKDRYRAYWLDMWKLIFCLIGINMADLWGLQKISQGRVSYSRQKTGRLYSIKVEPEAKALIEAHKGRKSLVNLSERYVSVHRATASINKMMQEMGKELGLPHITAYTARYTWATLAAGIDIPIEVISQALGHTYGLAVTLGYIMPDRRKVDEANRKVLDLLKA